MAYLSGSSLSLCFVLELSPRIRYADWKGSMQSPEEPLRQTIVAIPGQTINIRKHFKIDSAELSSLSAPKCMLPSRAVEDPFMAAPSPVFYIPVLCPKQDTTNCPENALENSEKKWKKQHGKTYAHWAQVKLHLKWQMCSARGPVGCWRGIGGTEIDQTRAKNISSAKQKPNAS